MTLLKFKKEKDTKRESIKRPLSKRELTLIIILLFLISAVSYYSFYYMPKSMQIASLRREIQMKSAEVDSALTRVIQYGGLTARKNALLETWDDSVRLLPALLDDADVLIKVQEAIGPYSSNIDIRFSNAPEEMQQTQIHNVDIGFIVTYEQLQFILETFSHKLVSNRILDLSYTVNESEELPVPLLNINMRVQFHTFKRYFDNNN